MRVTAGLLALLLLAAPLETAVGQQQPPQDTYVQPLADPALEERAKAMQRELRCVVCQGQSIDESNAPLAADMPVTRQAIAKHLAALRDAGLAVAEPEGRENRYRLTPAPFAEAMRWMAGAGAKWDQRLARLERRLQS